MSKVNQDIIKKIEEAQLKTDVPAFSAGDTVQFYNTTIS